MTGGQINDIIIAANQYCKVLFSDNVKLIHTQFGETGCMPQTIFVSVR